MKLAVIFFQANVGNVLRNFTFGAVFYCIQYILLWNHVYFLLIFFTCTFRNIFTVNLRRGLTKMLRTCCEHKRGTFAYRYVFVVEENFYRANFLCHEVTVTKIVTTQCVGYC